MTDLNRFFEKSELIPAIVQDASNGEVLMLAYMNAESLRLTLETRKCTFSAAAADASGRRGRRADIL